MLSHAPHWSGSPVHDECDSQLLSEQSKFYVRRQPFLANVNERRLNDISCSLSSRRASKRIEKATSTGIAHSYNTLQYRDLRRNTSRSATRTYIFTKGHELNALHGESPEPVGGAIAASTILWGKRTLYSLDCRSLRQRAAMYDIEQFLEQKACLRIQY
jgi:hypothetical protein